MMRSPRSVLDRDGLGFVVASNAVVTNECSKHSPGGATRDAIRAGLYGLGPDPQRILCATFVGRKPTPTTDVENLLFNNIDQTASAFRSLAAAGLQFEHDARSPASGTLAEYRYRLVEASRARFATHLREPIRTWSDAKLPALPTAETSTRLASRAWWAMRNADALGRGCLFASERFAITIRLGGSELLPADAIKGALDGVVAAFQVQADHAHAGRAATFLSSLLPGNQDEISALLTSHPDPVLGRVPRLLTDPKVADFRWRPDDHRCVAGRIVRDLTATTGPALISGELWRADASPRAP